MDLERLEGFRRFFMESPHADVSAWRSWSPEKFLAALEARTALGEMRPLRQSDSPLRTFNLAALRFRVELARRDGKLSQREIRMIVAELYRLRHEPAWKSLLRDPREMRDSLRIYTEELILERLEKALVAKAAVDSFREAGLLTPRTRWERALDWVEHYRGRYELGLSALFLLPTVIRMDVFSFYFPRWEKRRAEEMRDRYLELVLKEGHAAARRQVVQESTPDMRHEMYYSVVRSTANTVIFAALIYALTDEIIQNVQVVEAEQAKELEEMKRLVGELLPAAMVLTPEEQAEEMLQKFLAERSAAGQPVPEAMIPTLRRGFTESFQRAAAEGQR